MRSLSLRPSFQRQQFHFTTTGDAETAERSGLGNEGDVVDDCDDDDGGGGGGGDGGGGDDDNDQACRRMLATMVEQAPSFQRHRYPI